MSSESRVYLLAATNYARSLKASTASNTMLLTSIVGVMNNNEMWEVPEIAGDVEVLNNLIRIVATDSPVPVLLCHLAAVKVAERIYRIL